MVVDERLIERVGDIVQGGDQEGGRTTGGIADFVGKDLFGLFRYTRAIVQAGIEQRFQRAPRNGHSELGARIEGAGAFARAAAPHQVELVLVQYALDQCTRPLCALLLILIEGILRLRLLHLEQPANLHSAFDPRLGALLAQIGLGQRGRLILLVLLVFLHLQRLYLFHLRTVRHHNLALFRILFRLTFAALLVCLAFLTLRSDGSTALLNTEL